MPEFRKLLDGYRKYRVTLGTLPPKGREEPLTFKKWLAREHKARITADTVRKSAGRLTSIPDELSRLGLRIRELGAFPATGS